MDPDIDPKLESLIDAELKLLPPVKAPASLAPRVMALLAARERLPWWQRAWWDWPLAAKMAFLVIGVALAAVAGSGGVMIDQRVATYSQEVTGRFSTMSSLWDSFHTLSGTAGLLWQKAAHPFLLHALIVAGALYVACLGLGTAFVRSVTRRE
jgi:hypothetical protein